MSMSIPTAEAAPADALLQFGFQGEASLHHHCLISVQTLQHLHAAPTFYSGLDEMLPVGAGSYFHEDKKLAIGAQDCGFRNA